METSLYWSCSRELTSFHRASCGMLSKVDNPDPTIEGHASTILGLGDGSLFPSNVFAPQSLHA